MKLLWIQEARVKLGLHSGEAWRVFIRAYNERHAEKLGIYPSYVTEEQGYYEKTRKKYITKKEFERLLEFQRIRGKLCDLKKMT